MYNYEINMREMSLAHGKVTQVNKTHMMGTCGMTQDEYEEEMFNPKTFYFTSAQELVNHTERMVRDLAGDSFLRTEVAKTVTNSRHRLYKVYATSSLEPLAFKSAFGDMWELTFNGMFNVTEVSSPVITLRNDVTQSCLDHVYIRNMDSQPIPMNGEIYAEFKCKNCNKPMMKQLEVSI